MSERAEACWPRRTPLAQPPTLNSALKMAPDRRNRVKSKQTGKHRSALWVAEIGEDARRLASHRPVDVMAEL